METPHRTTFDNQFIELESVDSTNNYAMALVHEGLATDGMVCLAHHQTAGKGQRDRIWESEAGKNLMMSLISQPAPLTVSSQFIFSASVALGILDKLREHVPGNWRIKWPNDIYWNDRKAAGILIESVLKGQNWLFAVIGVGLNLNQESFSETIHNAISLHQVTGVNYETVPFARELVAKIQIRIGQARTDAGKILQEFNTYLYKKDEIITLKKGNELFVTLLKGVDARGHLLTEAGSFSAGEIQWVINPGNLPVATG